MTFSRAIMLAHADRIRSALREYCGRLEPTGALRRGDPTSSALEFICQTEDQDAVIERCRRHTYIAERRDELLAFTLENGLEVRFWFARFQEGDLFESPFDNFEVLQVIHTPTRSYLRGFVQHVREAGLSLTRHDGLVTPDNSRVASTEEGIYAALNLELPAPACRLEFRPPLGGADQGHSGSPASLVELARCSPGARGPNGSPVIS